MIYTYETVLKEGLDKGTYTILLLFILLLLLLRTTYYVLLILTLYAFIYIYGTLIQPLSKLFHK